MRRSVSNNWLLTCAAASILAGFLLLPRCQGARPVVMASLSPLELKANENITFDDRTAGALRRRWEFGNGTAVANVSGKHAWSKPGNYLVRLTGTTRDSGRYSRTFRVQVSPDIPPHVLRMIGPSSCYQGEKVVFRTTGGNPVQFLWHSGDAHAEPRANLTEAVAIFSYRQPGVYTVRLRVAQQGGAQPPSWRLLTQQVDVLAFPWAKRGPASLRAQADAAAVIVDIQRHLQFIADGRSFNEHYRYLMTKHFTQHPPPVIRANGLLQPSFYFYCMSLRLVKGWQIDAIQVERTRGTGRVTHLNMVQHRAE